MAVLNIEAHNRAKGFQKLAYLIGLLEIPTSFLASIVDEPESTVTIALQSGTVPPTAPSPEQLHEKLYLLRMFFSDLLRIAGYELDSTKKLLQSKDAFHGCLQPPPWTPLAALEYLYQQKTTGISAAVTWLHKY